MQAINTIIALLSLLHLVFASDYVLDVIKRENATAVDAAEYLEQICFPNFSNFTWRTEHRLPDPFVALSDSPFPCERLNYFLRACAANGTTEIDFLAEQQCLCSGGAFWELYAGCNDCYTTHGDTRNSSSVRSSRLASLQTAECSATRLCQPFSMLLPPMTKMTGSAVSSARMTLGHDEFPSDTAVSNYWTSTRSLTLGGISGSATARQTVWTNTGEVSYVPTCTNIPATTGTSSVASSSSGSSSPSPSASGNIAAVLVTELRMTKVLVAVAFGAAILL
jgi:hypothetical protein